MKSLEEESEESDGLYEADGLYIVLLQSQLPYYYNDRHIFPQLNAIGYYSFNHVIFTEATIRGEPLFKGDVYMNWQYLQ